MYWTIGAAGIAIAAIIYNFWQTNQLKRRLNAALAGTDGVSLEKVLAAHLQRVEAVDNRLVKLTDSYKQLAKVAASASQKISIVRFNPFGDTGGDQSFSLAVLDAHDSGYVFTSIHGREGTRVYIKPVASGQSKYPLSKEEQQALERAAKMTPASA